MTKSTRRSVALAAVALSFWGVAHSGAMSSGAAAMHEGMSPSMAIELVCMLVVGIAAVGVLRAGAPTIRHVAVGTSSPLQPRLEWRGATAGAPARASPIWLQRLRR